jgi:hypothetical protein
MRAGDQESILPREGGYDYLVQFDLEEGQRAITPCRFWTQQGLHTTGGGMAVCR